MYVCRNIDKNTYFIMIENNIYNERGSLNTGNIILRRLTI